MTLKMTIALKDLVAIPATKYLRTIWHDFVVYTGQQDPSFAPIGGLSEQVWTGFRQSVAMVAADMRQRVCMRDSFYAAFPA